MLEPSSWDISREMVIYKTTAGIQLNAQLQQVMRTAQEALSKLPDAANLDDAANAIKAALFGDRGGIKDTDRFVYWFKKFIDTKDNRSTKGIYQHTLNRIRQFDSEIDNRTFADIDLQWLTDYEAWCAKTACQNARSIHLRNIRAVFNYAISYEATEKYPFRRFKIKNEPTSKRSLSAEELRRVFDYPAEEYAIFYRDMFKLIFLLIGINTADLHALTDIVDGRIIYKRAKTGRRYSIKVEPEAMEIINKYRGQRGLTEVADRWTDCRNFGHQLNKALKRMGQLRRVGRGGRKVITPEWPFLTSYWARHSWATIAYSIGISKDVIAQALGHSDGHDVTNIYIDDDPALVDAANRRVIDWVLYGKK